MKRNGRMLNFGLGFALSNKKVERVQRTGVEVRVDRDSQDPRASGYPGRVTRITLACPKTGREAAVRLTRTGSPDGSVVVRGPGFGSALVGLGGVWSTRGAVRKILRVILGPRNITSLGGRIIPRIVPGVNAPQAAA